MYDKSVAFWRIQTCVWASVLTVFADRENMIERAPYYATLLKDFHRNMEIIFEKNILEILLKR